MLKRCVLFTILFVVCSLFVFAAGGTHSASEVSGGTFRDVASYSVGTSSSDQQLTLYQTGATSNTVNGENRVTGGIGVKGTSTVDGTGVQGTSTSGVGVRGVSSSNYGAYGTSDTGTGVVGTSASGYGVFGSSSAGFSGYFMGSKFQVLADGGNPSDGNCPAGSLWVDNNPANNAKNNGECYAVSLYSTAGGLIGMGTTAPSQKLDVVGYVKGTGLCMGSDCRTAWPGADATSGSCAAGSAIRVIAADGTVTCQAVDPKIGTLTNAKWCTSDGSQVICNTAAPLTSFTEADPQVGTVTNGNWCVGDASGNVQCNQAAPLTSFTEADPQVGTISTNYLPKWDGSALVSSTVQEVSSSDYSWDGTPATEWPYKQLSIVGSSGTNVKIKMGDKEGSSGGKLILEGSGYGFVSGGNCENSNAYRYNPEVALRQKDTSPGGGHTWLASMSLATHNCGEPGRFTLFVGDEADYSHGGGTIEFRTGKAGGGLRYAKGYGDVETVWRLDPSGGMVIRENQENNNIRGGIYLAQDGTDFWYSIGGTVPGGNRIWPTLYVYTGDVSQYGVDSGSTFLTPRGGSTKDLAIVVQKSVGTGYHTWSFENDGVMATPSAANDGIADLAELFKSEDAKPGTILALASDGTGKISSTPYQKPLLGVVSDTTSILMGGSGNDINDSARIAVAGRVWVNVNSENGLIKVGDPIVASSTPGIGMRGDESKITPLNMVGIALQPLSSGSGKIVVLVK